MSARTPDRERGSGGYEVVVVGGGPAGLSAALVLGRARRRVLVLDAGGAANAVSGEVSGLLAQEDVSPMELRRVARRQLSLYHTVALRAGEVVEAAMDGGAFTVVSDDGSVVHARKLLIAHGLRYERPAVEGIEALWGSAAFHCPFCDAWDFQDRPLAVYGRGADAAYYAILLTGWTRDVVLCTDGPAELDAARHAALGRAGVRTREQRIVRLVADGRRLERIEFETGPPEQRGALFFLATLRQPNRLARRLGCRLTDLGMIATDEDGRTGVPGLYATGDTAGRGGSVATAIGMAARSAKVIAAELIEEAFGHTANDGCGRDSAAERTAAG